MLRSLIVILSLITFSFLLQGCGGTESACEGRDESCQGDGSNSESEGLNNGGGSGSNGSGGSIDVVGGGGGSGGSGSGGLDDHSSGTGGSGGTGGTGGSGDSGGTSGGTGGTGGGTGIETSNPGDSGGNGQVAFSVFSIISQPRDIDVEIGDPSHFSFVVMGPPPISYKWYKVKDGADELILTSTSVYQFRHTFKADEGLYYATATDSRDRTLTSERARLKTKPGRRPCSDGDYVPRKMSNGNLNYNVLIPKADANYNTKHIKFELKSNRRDSYFQRVNCKYGDNNYRIDCLSGEKLYQCRDRNLIFVRSSCICGRYDMGGGDSNGDRDGGLGSDAGDGDSGGF